MDEVSEFINSSQTTEYAHTLEDQIQGQIEAGLVISGFYEVDFGNKNFRQAYYNFYCNESDKAKSRLSIFLFNSHEN